jgi:hypothetical protein
MAMFNDKLRHNFTDLEEDCCSNNGRLLFFTPLTVFGLF